MIPPRDDELRTHEANFSLHQAVGHAMRAHGPVRIWHDDGETFAEIYFNRGMVIHAHVNGLGGVPALAAMLGAPLAFDLEYEVWPTRCTLLAEWEALCREADRQRHRCGGRMSPRDEDATAPLPS